MKDDVQANRLWNFRQLIRSAGGTNEAARILGKKNSQVTAIGGPNPNRAIGNKIAAQIELAFGLHPGSLDAPPPKQAQTGDRYLSQLASTLANASDSDKEFVVAVADWIVSRSIKTPQGLTGIEIKPSDV